MYPRLSYFFPRITDGVQESARPNIVLDWSVSIVTSQFSLDADRARYVVLTDDVTNEVIDTEFVSYTASNRRVLLQPAQDLLRNRQYRVLVKSGILSTDGRRSIDEYHWEFLTATTEVGQATLLEPAHESILSVFPTLSWLAAPGTGTVYYLVQIDDRPDFGSVNWSTTTTASSVTPAGSFDSNETYYWRVLAFTTTASGAWTEPRAFYFGSVNVAHPTSDQTWQESDVFGVASLGFDDLSSNLSAFPSNLSITFTSAPASTFGSYVSITKKAIRPRNDSVSTYAEAAVTGSWTQSGNTLTFTPGEAITANTRYTIRIQREMVNTNDLELGEDLQYTFTGPYSPYYCDLLTIRARLLSGQLRLPDDLINYYIYMASLEANARYYGAAQMSIGWGDGLTESLVRDQTPLVSFGVGKWVEAVVVFRLLMALLIENVPNIGLSRQLGDFKESLSDDFRKGIEAAQKAAKEEVREWENLLTPSAVPTVAPRMARWHPSNWDVDWSIGETEALRDDWWRRG